MAQSRMLAHYQAALWETMAAVTDAGDESVEDEVRLILSWTRLHTSSQLATAVALRDRLPETLRAVSEGRIHARVAEVIEAGTSDLDVDEAQAVEARILAAIEKASDGCDGMGGLTTGQVRERLQRLVHQVDPKAAAAV